MSNLPDSNAGEAGAWLDRAHIQAIAHSTPVPRRHDTWELLSACPVDSVRERVSAAFGQRTLNRFSSYYLPDPGGEDADQGIYARCSQITQQVVQCAEDALQTKRETMAAIR